MTFKQEAELIWEAEEYHCIRQFMDKLNVPKESPGGQKYSSVGRIKELMRMCESNNYEPRILSNNDFIDNVVNKIQHE